MARARQLARTTRRAVVVALLLTGAVVSASDAHVARATTDTTPGGTSDASSPAPDPAGRYQMQTSGVPRLEERSSCPANVPPSDRVRCLTLVVPESRRVATAGSGRLVRLPVAIIAATDPSQQLDDPVLWINYTAGDGSIANRVREFTGENEPLNAHRDVITLDLRGTGGAEPVLDCPEVVDLNTGAFLEVDETTAEGRAMRRDAVEQCHDRLVADGVDLSSYSADDAARDLDDLRVALGIEQWNIVAGEYGSKLAQILARDEPASVRSVIVNAGPIPLQADWFADLAGNAERGWLALAAACAADSGCNEAYPRLDNRLEALVADLTANPRHYDDVTTWHGAHHPFLLTASRLLQWVSHYGRDPQFTGIVPFYLAGPPTERPDEWPEGAYDPDDPTTLTTLATDTYCCGAWWGLWEMLPQNAGAEYGSFALGAQLSALCRDEAPFTDPAGLAAAADVALFGPFLGHPVELDDCDAWAVEPAPPSANEPVESDVPFLVLAGDLDTISSPAWADAFRDGLSAAQVVHFPGVGNWPTGGTPSTAQTCARQIRDQFLAEPNALVDTTCVSTSHGPPFILP